MASYDTTKLTNLAALKSLAEKVKENCESIETRVGAINVPTRVGELTNDKGYQTSAEVNTAIQTAISKTGHASFKVVTALPEAAVAEDNVLYLYKNTESGFYDIYAKVTEGGTAKLLRIDDTTVDLSAYSTTAQIEAAYVKKDGSKVLSTNDYTTDDKKKLAGIEAGANNYTHPESAAGAKEAGLYKITTDTEGHVTGATEVVKADITALGIPERDTTYEDATIKKSGLMSADDKVKADAVTAFLGMKNFKGVINNEAEMTNAYEGGFHIGDWWLVAFNYGIPTCFGPNGFDVGTIIIAQKECEAGRGGMNWGDNFSLYAKIINPKNTATPAIFVPSGGREGQILKCNSEGFPIWADA